MCVLSCSPSVFYRSCDLQVMVLSCKSAVIDHPKAVFRQLDGKQLKLAVNGASFAVTTITHWAPAEREALDSLLATLTFLGFAVGRRKGGSWLFNRAAAAAGMPPHIVMPDICSGVDWCRVRLRPDRFCRFFVLRYASMRQKSVFNFRRREIIEFC